MLFHTFNANSKEYELWGIGANYACQLMSNTHKPVITNLATMATNGDDEKIIGNNFTLKTFVSQIKAMSSGAAYNYYLLINGSVYSNGLGYIGQLASGNHESQELPQPVRYKAAVSVPVVAQLVKAGYNFAFVYTVDRCLYATGNNSQGQVSILDF